MENLNVNQEMNFEEMADVVGGGDNKYLTATQCDDLQGMIDGYDDAIVSALVRGNIGDQVYAMHLKSSVEMFTLSGGC
jgi:hypothetical protein